MRLILTPNPNPPYNLRKISPSPRLFKDMSEGEVLARVVWRNKETGLIPAETEAEREKLIREYSERHPNLDPQAFPSVGGHWIVDDSELPEDDLYFFNCWEWDDGCKINMTKARVLHMDAIRKVRNAELLALDLPYMRAIESGDTEAQTTIATQKQVLRDIPQTFDLMTDTATQLRNRWPEGLPRE